MWAWGGRQVEPLALKAKAPASRVASRSPTRPSSRSHSRSPSRAAKRHVRHTNVAVPSMGSAVKSSRTSSPRTFTRKKSGRVVDVVTDAAAAAADAQPALVREDAARFEAMEANVVRSQLKRQHTHCTVCVYARRKPTALLRRMDFLRSLVPSSPLRCCPLLRLLRPYPRACIGEFIAVLTVFIVLPVG